jgi:hypothetical protein
MPLRDMILPCGQSFLGHVAGRRFSQDTFLSRACLKSCREPELRKRSGVSLEPVCNVSSCLSGLVRRCLKVGAKAAPLGVGYRLLVSRPDVGDETLPLAVVHCCDKATCLIDDVRFCSIFLQRGCAFRGSLFR